jgi:putative transposase
MGKRGKAISALPMTDQQRQLLVRLLNAHGTGQQMAKRIKILLLAHQGQSHTEICTQAGVSYKTVLSWRERWQNAYEQLSLDAAKELSDRELSKYLLHLLKDLPRSGAPKVFTLEQRQQIVALACDNPAKHGIPISDWTHEMLAKTAIAKGIVDSISASHLGKILKK